MDKSVDKSKFIIPISNGILERKHYRQIKNALWLFIWFIDKSTRIDKNGVGWVFGGMPIKLKIIEKELGESRFSLLRDLARLKKYNYIQVIRAPYGLKIGVFKLQKRYAKNAISKMVYIPTGEQLIKRNGRLMAIPKDGGPLKIFTGDLKDIKL